MTRTFYRTDYGGVARLTRGASTVAVDLFDVGTRSWIPAPGIYGKLTGLGGDPSYDPIPLEDAIALSGETREELEKPAVEAAARRP